MNILALDLANSSGYCILKIVESKVHIIQYGFIEIDTTSSYLGDHCLNLQKRVKELIEKYKIEHLAIEDYFFSSKFATGSSVNVSYRTAIYMLARQMNIPYNILNISEWKKFIAGRCTPTKQQVEKWGKLDSKKLFIQQALWEKYKIRFPNHSLSEKTGKPILFRFDVVDVVAQGIFYVCKFKQITEIINDVTVPADVVHKGNVKKIFEYPSVS